MSACFGKTAAAATAPQTYTTGARSKHHKADPHQHSCCRVPLPTLWCHQMLIFQEEDMEIEETSVVNRLTCLFNLISTHFPIFNKIIVM